MTLKEAWVVLAQNLRDIGMEQVGPRQLTIFVNMAARDASLAQVLIPQTESTINIANDTWEYSVPSGFVFIHELETDYESEADVTVLADYTWRVELVSGTPTIVFDPRFIEVNDYTTVDVRLRGHKRPSEYTAAADTLDIGLESFLVNRATVYGARNLSRRQGQEAVYGEEANAFWTMSNEQLLQLLRDERYQKLETSRVVPGR